MALIRREHLCNYTKTNVFILMMDGRRFSGTFDGFDSQQIVRFHESVQIYKNPLLTQIEKKPKPLGTILLSLADIHSFYSCDLPLPVNLNQVLGEIKAAEQLHFCTFGRCKSLCTGIFPFGGYAGPCRKVSKCPQKELIVTCSFSPCTCGHHVNLLLQDDNAERNI